MRRSDQKRIAAAAVMMALDSAYYWHEKVDEEMVPSDREIAEINAEILKLVWALNNRLAKKTNHLDIEEILEEVRD